MSENVLIREVGRHGIGEDEEDRDTDRDKRR